MHEERAFGTSFLAYTQVPKTFTLEILIKMTAIAHR